MSIRYNNVKLASANTYHPDLFDVKWSDHILDNISWLRADTFSWHYGELYTRAYQHLTKDIADKTLQSETVADITIQYYLANDGHKICPDTEEENIQDLYEETGIAWYYIIDTTNHRFKLPRTKYAFTGVRNNVGKFVEAGLPNITGKTYSVPAQTTNTGTVFGEGAFSDTVTNENLDCDSSSRAHQPTVSLKFDASDSNSIYGNSETVQPQATEMYLYFYIGNFAQSALENVNKGHYVIEFQAPTAENNYTWYRKYVDGWVEMGGVNNDSTLAGVAATITLPVEMTDTNYTITATKNTDDTTATYGWGLRVVKSDKTVNSFKVRPDSDGGFFWRAEGMYVMEE